MRKGPLCIKVFIPLALCFLAITAFQFLSFADEIKIAADPVRIGVGARSLGMGKMGLALGDDCGSIFMNPAGIGSLNDWQIMSMTGRFINEVTYLQFGGTYKTEYGTFGIGYVGANIGAKFPVPELATLEGGGPGDWRVIPSTTEGYQYDYNNAVFLLSYGTRLRDYFDWDWIKGVSVGTNMKIFSEGLTGTEISGGTATGWDLDLGLMYKPLPWLSVGLNGSNIIPSDMGAKIIWADGVEEDIPASLKLGTAATVVGQEGPFQYGGHEVKVGLDADGSLSFHNLPVLFHLGAEWWPIEYAAIRVGVDQDYVGTGDPEQVTTTNNVTAGVGFLYSGFRFDYAFHQYNNIPENDTHYFSLSYNIWNEKKKPAPIPVAVAKEFLMVTKPADRSVVRAEKVTVMGQVDTEVKRATVNGADVSIGGNGDFAMDVPLSVGKNTINVAALDGTGKTLKKVKIRVLRLLSFRDVDPKYWARDVIEEIATIGIVTGYPDGTFGPDGSITRAEITTLLVRALGEKLPDVTENVFADLPSSHWAARYIKEGSNRKYVLGYPDGTFRPANSINKAEGVVLLARFGELTPAEKVIEAPYPGLPGRHWAAPLVTAAKQAGFLEYLGNRNFEPAANLSRAEAVEILSKTKFASGKIGDLMDFEKGY